MNKINGWLLLISFLLTLNELYNNFLELTAIDLAESKTGALGIMSIKKPLMQSQLRNAFNRLATLGGP